MHKCSTTGIIDLWYKHIVQWTTKLSWLFFVGNRKWARIETIKTLLPHNFSFSVAFWMQTEFFLNFFLSNCFCFDFGIGFSTFVDIFVCFKDYMKKKNEFSALNGYYPNGTHWHHSQLVKCWVNPLKSNIHSVTRFYWLLSLNMKLPGIPCSPISKFVAFAMNSGILTEHY